MIGDLSNFEKDGFIILRNFIKDENFNSLCEKLKKEVLLEFNKLDKTGGSLMGNLNISPGVYSKKIFDKLNPENFKNISPQVLIIFLEKKLKKEPNDLQGWLILSRTCVLSGHYQKADKYYKNALELFPKNENILLEIALLKKKTNQTESAEKYLNRLKILHPSNIKARELLIEIFTNNYMQMKAIKEYKELAIIKKGEIEYLESIKKKYNLN